MEKWNGVAMLPDSHWSAPGTHLNPQLRNTNLFTDACNTGFGAVWEEKWLHGLWSQSQLSAARRTHNLSMPYLELLATALALSSWGPQLTGRKLTVHSDSHTAVTAMQGGACKNRALMQLVRSIFWLAATHQFALRYTHVAGVKNELADALSRGRVQEFRSLSPKHVSGPTPVTPIPTRIW